MPNDDLIQQLKSTITELTPLFPIVRATLFGSRANGTYREDSDVDLIIEFNAPVSLITIGLLRERLEDILQLDVDLIHGPIQNSDMIDIGRSIELYAA